MPSTPPFFSVLMPTHQRPALLRRALQSLREQACQDFEIVLVADDWDAATATVAAELLRPQDLFLKRSGQPGPAGSRNEALRLAHGEWVVFLDDDDTFLPHHLQALMAQARQPDAQVLFTGYEVVTEDRTQSGTPTLSRQSMALGGLDVQALWVRNFIPNHTLAYRRALLQGLSFDEHLASLEDWDFLLSVCSRATPRHWEGGGVVMHKDYVNPGLRRGNSESSSNHLVVLDFLHIYRRWPAPDAALRAQRQALLAQVGLNLPMEWF